MKHDSSGAHSVAQHLGQLWQLLLAVVCLLGGQPGLVGQIIIITLHHLPPAQHSTAWHGTT